MDKIGHLDNVLVKPSPNRLYGRQRGHSLRPRQKKLLDETLPRIRLSLEQIEHLASLFKYSAAMFFQREIKRDSESEDRNDLADSNSQEDEWKCFGRAVYDLDDEGDDHHICKRVGYWGEVWVLFKCSASNHSDKACKRAEHDIPESASREQVCHKASERNAGYCRGGEDREDTKCLRKSKLYRAAAHSDSRTKVGEDDVDRRDKCRLAKVANVFSVFLHFAFSP